MPPPSWIGTLSPTAAIIWRITFSFFGRPAIAPFRSTMCRRLAPCAAQCLAIATGSSENTVAVFMSPCFRRTQRPSFRSIAGMMSTGVLELYLSNESGTPVHEIGEESQAGGLAFFRMELDGKNIIPGDGTGKGYTVDRGRGGQCGIAGRGVIAVHEVEAGAVRDPLPQGVRSCLHHFVPSHVGNLDSRGVKPRHPARQYAQPGGVAF